MDALLVAQDYVGESKLSNTLADVNGDNNVNSVDALLIAQFYVKQIPALPGCKEETPVITPKPIETSKPGTRCW